MSKTSTKHDLAEMCEEFLAIRDQAKKLYSDADDILREIAEDLDSGAEIKFRDAKGRKMKYVLLDKFEGASELWGHACVRRYDILEAVDE